MGLLDKFDLAYLFDKEWTDLAGDRRTADRSRHGIHALVGDGTTAATMPTWDADRGLYTFDGGDYMTIRQADDVGDVLANMGSIQDETYLFCFDPWVESAGNLIVLFAKDDSGGTGALVKIEKTAADEFEFTVDSGAGSEVVTTAGGEPGAYNGRGLLLTCTRSTDSQAIYAWTVEAASDTDASVDGSNGVDGSVGADATPANYFPSGTGLRAFLYGRFAANQIQLRQLTTYLRGVI